MFFLATRLSRTDAIRSRMRMLRPKARKAGATLRAIGDAVGISKEWVR
jgi:hypothetical protein